MQAGSDDGREGRSKREREKEGTGTELTEDRKSVV